MSALFDNNSGPTIAERRAAYRKIMFTLTIPRQQRAVLRAIHEHAGLIPEFELTLKQLAHYLDAGISTVRDAKNWLVERELLIEKPRFRQRCGSGAPEQLPSGYTISWLNVANTLPADARAEVLRMLHVPPSAGGGVVQTVEGVVQTVEGVVQTVEPCTFSFSLDSSSSLSLLQKQNTLHCTAPQARASNASAVPCRAVGFENSRGESSADANRPTHGQADGKTSEVSETSEASPASSPCRRGNPWPFEVTAADLSDPHRIKTLFGAAVNRGWWVDSEAGRLSFATLCVYVAREARQPGHLLTVCARSGKHDGTLADEGRARRLVEIAWSGIDSAAAEARLDAMTDSEFREWARPHFPERERDGFDVVALYGREQGSSFRSRLIRMMALELAEGQSAERDQP
jgi:hypothetical protein